MVNEHLGYKKHQLLVILAAANNNDNTRMLDLCGHHLNGSSITPLVVGQGEHCLYADCLLQGEDLRKAKNQCDNVHGEDKSYTCYFFRTLKRVEDERRKRYSFHDLKPDGGNDDTRNRKGKRDDRGHDEGRERYRGRGKDQAKIAKKGKTSRKDKPLAILMVQPWQRIARQRITQTFSSESVISFPTLGEEDGTEGPMIIEAGMGGHCVHRIYVDGGSSSEILYEHCFSKFRPEIKNQLILANTSLVGFSGEIIWPLGQRSLLVRIGDEEHSMSAWMNFMVVISPSPYNEIIGRSGVRKIRTIPSTAHRMIKFPVAGGIVTLQSNRIIPLECLMVSKPRVPRSAINQVREEKIQRLVDKAFQKQIGRNLEVYVDDLVIKSRTKKEVIRDTEEMFKTLRKINMKLNPKKCAFGMREGTFLGYKVDAAGLRVSPNKVKAVLDLPSPKCLKDVQKLNGKLASLNKFLSKSAEKSLPFFKRLKKSTKKSDFQWTPKTKGVFKEMKQSIAELSMLTTSKEKGGVDYVSGSCERSHLRSIDNRKRREAKVTGRLLKWRFELGEHDIQYRPMTSVKGQILADFIVERPEDDATDTPMEDREELPDPWILFTDGSSCIDGSGAGLIITNPEGLEFTYALRFRFNATNNEAEYEALIAGLRIARQMGVQNLQANMDSKLVANQANYVLREIHEGSCSMHAGPRSVVAKALRSAYFWPIIYTDARNLIKGCKDCQVHRPVPRNSQEKLTPITSPRKFYKWGINIAGPFPEGPGKVEEVSHVLWAHRTMIKSSNGETPFSLTYGAEAVIPAKIGMPTLRTTEVDIVKNNEALGISLDLLEEKREQAAIQEARNKARMEGYYNVRVRSTNFRPGDFVYQSNEASYAKDGGKLRPKWEGPYEVTEALGKGAYRLRDRNGCILSRTWNICNLKKCYMHEM
nr:reverse transcriptase domain-containing protein [Tanacetum cinerariifolium]